MPQDAKPVRWAYDLYHPHFGWLPWEPGDKSYETRSEAEEQARQSGYTKPSGGKYPVRVVQTY